MRPRQTNQRRAVIDAISGAPGPLRPMEILEIASDEVPTLGIATVYRHLKRLQDAGEVHAVELGVGDVRYEPTDRELLAVEPVPAPTLTTVRAPPSASVIDAAIRGSARRVVR